jgi:hypothetical protein
MGTALAAMDDEIPISGDLDTYDDDLIRKATGGFYQTEQDAFEKALPHIASKGHYRHSDIIRELGVSKVVGDAIAWDKVRRGLSILIKHELMPISDSYFLPLAVLAKKGWTYATHPEKFLAIGHAKRTGGAIMIIKAPVEMSQRWSSKVIPALLRGLAEKQKRVFEELAAHNLLPNDAQTPMQIARTFALINGYDPIVADVDDMDDVDIDDIDEDDIS